MDLSGDWGEDEAGVVAEVVEGAMEVGFGDGVELRDDRGDLGGGEAGAEGAVDEEGVGH